MIRVSNHRNKKTHRSFRFHESILRMWAGILKGKIQLCLKMEPLEGEIHFGFPQHFAVNQPLFFLGRCRHTQLERFCETHLENHFSG